jgi:hypothetical protein
VILDSDHHADARQPRSSPRTRPGDAGIVLIVEDTNVNGGPVLPSSGPGPAKRSTRSWPTHPEFVADPLPERYLVTMHPGGWLRRLCRDSLVASGIVVDGPYARSYARSGFCGRSVRAAAEPGAS